MLNLDVKKLLLRELPSSLTLDGHSFTIKRTIGSTPLNELSLPTINIKFIGEGAPYYRSFDDGHVYNDTLNKYRHTYTCSLRFTCAAIDTIITTSESIKYVEGTSKYALARVPILDITSITGFVKNTDYRLSSDRTMVEWIGTTPANNITFTIEYTWINSGFYIANQMIDYIMQDVNGRVFDLLRPYGINIINSKGIVDLSDIYTNDALSAFSFDIIITYPFAWSTSIASDDATLAETIILDLYVNEINTGTIVTINS
jgi:hypothetical protein